MGQKLAIVASAILGLAATGIAHAQTKPMARLPSTCGDELKSQQTPSGTPYQVDVFGRDAAVYRSLRSKTAGGGSNPFVLLQDEEARFLRDYCTAHPEDKPRAATDALKKHEAELAAAIAAICDRRPRR